MIPSEPSTLKFFVNGRKVVDSNVDPEWTLLYYLRNKLGLCGTKLGCAEGGCGACTVMVSRYDRNQNKLIHLSVNACLAPVCSMHGLAVTTVEGIGSTKARLHPVQERLAKAHGSQCGFCTPGIVMSMYSLLRSLPKPSMKDLEVALQGNLCRCTGYRPIIEGFKTFTEDYEIMQNNHMLATGNGTCGMGDKCCKLKKDGTNVIGDIDATNMDEVLFHPNKFVPHDPTQEPIFPPELQVNDILDKENLYFQGMHTSWFRPTTLDQLLELKTKYPDSKLITGNTEVGVEVKFKKMQYPVLIQPIKITEMTEIIPTKCGLKVGASVTLTDMEEALNHFIRDEPEHKTRIFKQIVDMLHWFAGKQIRNVAAVGGNIMTGSPISDLNPIFMAANIELELQSKRGVRKVNLDNTFFTGYRRNIVSPSEILVSILIPYTKENQYFYAYKQARRRDDDIAIVNSAINVIFKENTNKNETSDVIEKIDLAFGGMAPTTVAARKTSSALVGLSWNKEMLAKALDTLSSDLPLSPSAPGGMIDYRKSLTLSFFFKAYLAISKQLPNHTVDQRELSGIDGFHMKIPKSSQYFAVHKDRENYDTVGRPTLHMSALKQATGEAIYVDDIPHYKNELYMGFVTSTKAHAKILSVDPKEALNIKGVRAFFSAKDLEPSKNITGSIFKDEEIFRSEIVQSEGQTIGIIIAEDQLIAQRAARIVTVEYEELHPVIITNEDAIKHESFFPLSPLKIECGDVDKVFKECPHVLEGECRTGGQEQFYLESQTCLVNPKNEDDEIEIYSSTQHPTEVSDLVAHTLGIPINRVVTRVKRIGGGFGGKESKGNLLTLPAAIAATKLGVPIRCMLDRDEDMLMTAGRHPFLMKYKVGFDNNGRILALEVYMYANSGYSYDLSTAVVQRALFHVQNAYNIQNIRTVGYVCKTNLPSNTAFRGFGGPQGMFAAECVIDDISAYLKKDAAELSRINLYQEGDATHYRQRLEHCTIQRCWDQCLSSSDYNNRKNHVAEYNRLNRWKKRGLSVIPTMFGIAFTLPTLNQAGALVLVYLDGSVLLSHSGVEMGQGLHTKMIQIASKVLGIPTTKIHIVETATDKVPNTSATAASVGSDLNGPAVMEACQTIITRLEPIKKKFPDKTWEGWINEAYKAQISLSATGFHSTKGVGYDWNKGEGHPFNYFVYGVACTEVEIDCLTGDHQVLRTDIVMDIGESINPAIDVGQIEGGFVQGYGMFCLEEMVYSPKGTLFTRGPGAYKIPGFGDIPLEFNVALLKGAPNPRAVYSSKAVGEPPLFLASSVLFAIKDAIKSARNEVGVDTPFKLDAPATAAKIRMACPDFVTDKIKTDSPGTFVPWNVIP